MNIKWDGSYYGEINRKDIITSFKKGSNNIKLIDLGKVQVWCYTKRTDDDFVCFYDEVKPLFGLIKQGTLKIRIGKFNYIICRYYHLSKIKPIDYDMYSDDISKILVFKRIMKVSESLKDIYLTNDGNVLDLSFGKYLCRNRMRGVFIKRFFPKDKDFEEILFYEMIKKDYKDKIDCILKIEDKIEKLTSHIVYSSIGTEELAQQIGDYRDKLFS